MQTIYNPSVTSRQLPLHKGASGSTRLFSCFHTVKTVLKNPPRMCGIFCFYKQEENGEQK